MPTKLIEILDGPAGTRTITEAELLNILDRTYQLGYREGVDDMLATYEADLSSHIARARVERRLKDEAIARAKSWARDHQKKTRTTPLDRYAAAVGVA